MHYKGFNVILSDGGNWSPNRPHAKRRNQGKRSYHRRIAKKWRKRFGERWNETQPRGTVYKLGNHSIVVRREDWPVLQAAVTEEQGP